jgi:uncharacterized protein (DUF302 family)
MLNRTARFGAPVVLGAGDALAFSRRQPILAGRRRHRVAAFATAVVVGVSASAPMIHQGLAQSGPSRTLAMNPDGLTIYPSDYGPKETLDRVAAAVTDSGNAVLARIDHGAAAAKAGLELRPTEVLIFGNARAGTPLMQEAQTIGIDLPLKVLVWQDNKGQTWLGYNDPSWLAKRHGADIATAPVLAAMTAGLERLAKLATSQTAGRSP